MKDGFLNSVQKIAPAKSFALVTVRLNATHNTYAIQFINEKNSKLFLGTFYEYLEEDQLEKNLKPEIPVLLSFQGSKVLSKEIDVKEDNETVLFSESIEDFFISETIYHHHKYLSIVRKEDVIQSLELFAKIKTTVLDFSVGPFISVILKDFIDEPYLVSEDYKLNFIDISNTISYEKKEDQSRFYLGEDQVNRYQIPLISTYFNYKNESAFIEGKAALLKPQLSEFRKHTIFSNALMIVVVLILVSLVISTFLKDHYQDRYVEAEAQLFFLEKSYNEIVSLEQEKEQLESIVSNLSGFSEEYYTHYVYYLMKTLPHGIRIENVNLNPVIGNMKKEVDAAFSLNQIILKGTVEASKNLDDWMQIIKKEKWVKSLEMIELYQDRNNNLLFTLQIDF